MDRSTTAGATRTARDHRLSEMTIARVPREDQRQVRAATQVVLAAQLKDALTVCINENLFMALAALMRSLIDATVLGLWFLKYVDADLITASVAHLELLRLVEGFDSADKPKFDFLFTKIKGTEFTFYKDVLNPSVHGDSLHLVMRTRDSAATAQWVRMCHSNAGIIYRHLCEAFFNAV